MLLCILSPNFRFNVLSPFTALSITSFSQFQKIYHAITNQKQLLLLSHWNLLMPSDAKNMLHLVKASIVTCFFKFCRIYLFLVNGLYALHVNALLICISGINVSPANRNVLLYCSWLLLERITDYFKDFLK